MLMDVEVATSGRNELTDAQLQATQEYRLREDRTAIEVDSTSSSSVVGTPKQQTRVSTSGNTSKRIACHQLKPVAKKTITGM